MLYLAIPAQNEVATIGVLLWRLRTVLAEFPREYEVVVYDDASTDETADVAEQYASAMPVTVIRGKTAVGYAGAVDALVRHVSAATRYPRRDALLLLQGDFTDPPGIVPEFARRFEGGADLVVGERTAVVDAPVPVKRLFSAAGWALRPFVRVDGVRDLTGSMRLVRVSVLRDLLRGVDNGLVCEGDTWTANADFLLRLVPHARRIESVPMEPTYGVRMRDTRRATVRDALASLRWGWRARGRRVLPIMGPESAVERNRDRAESSRDTLREISRDGGREEQRDVAAQSRDAGGRNQKSERTREGRGRGEKPGQERDSSSTIDALAEPLQNGGARTRSRTDGAASGRNAKKGGGDGANVERAGESRVKEPNRSESLEETAARAIEREAARAARRDSAKRDGPREGTRGAKRERSQGPRDGETRDGTKAGAPLDASTNDLANMAVPIDAGRLLDDPFAAPRRAADDSLSGADLFDAATGRIERSADRSPYRSEAPSEAPEHGSVDSPSSEDGPPGETTEAGADAPARKRRRNRRSRRRRSGAEGAPGDQSNEDNDPAAEQAGEQAGEQADDGRRADSSRSRGDEFEPRDMESSDDSMDSGADADSGELNEENGGDLEGEGRTRRRGRRGRRGGARRSRGRGKRDQGASDGGGAGEGPVEGTAAGGSEGPEPE